MDDCSLLVTYIIHPSKRKKLVCFIAQNIKILFSSGEGSYLLSVDNNFIFVLYNMYISYYIDITS